MKFIFLAVFISLSLSSMGQQAVQNCFVPACKQTITAGDTANVFAQLTSSNGIGSFSWTQQAGPAIQLPAQQVASFSKQVAQTSFSLRLTQPGTYIFQASAKTAVGGTIDPVYDTVVVNAATRRIAYVLTVYTDSTRTKNQ